MKDGSLFLQALLSLNYLLLVLLNGTSDLSIRVVMISHRLYLPDHLIPSTRAFLPSLCHHQVRVFETDPIPWLRSPFVGLRGGPLVLLSYRTIALLFDSLVGCRPCLVRDQPGRWLL
jgi:hypothetical protein